MAIEKAQFFTSSESDRDDWHRLFRYCANFLSYGDGSAQSLPNLVGYVRWLAGVLGDPNSRYEHLTPVTADAFAVLELAWWKNPGIGDAPLLSVPKDPSLGVSTFAGARLVGESPRARRAGAEAGPRLALPQAEDRLGPSCTNR